MNSKLGITKSLKNASVATLSALVISGAIAQANDIPTGADNFYTSDKVDLKKVNFNTQFNIKVAGNLFLPKAINKEIKYPAIIVGHPMGAVKEQSATLYATKMAELGFITIAIDLPYWGESEGSPRSAVSPDMYAEAFSAAADYLGNQSFVDKDKIGVIGICGSGGFAISAAKIDLRLKAIATVSMYDMGEATRTGIKQSQSVEQKNEMLKAAGNQRNAEFAGADIQWLNYLPVTLPENPDPVTKAFHNFYRTSRAAVIPEGRTLEITQNRTLTQEVRFMNFYPFNDIESISPRPLLFIAGENAHSRDFSETAYKKAAEPKELYWVPKADHVDLYDRIPMIPFTKLEQFFKQHLK